jgi:hypothetical protein
MALTTTTAASAIGATDLVINVASATGFAAGNLIICDQEVMRQLSAAVGTAIPVIRGVNGTAAKAHVSSANVTTGLPSEFSGSADQVASAITYPTQRARTITSYSAAGAITLPTPGTDAMAIINGTGALAMTLANPTKDQDGDILIIVGNGKAAHTVTYTAGLGNAGSNYDVGTFDGSGQCSMMLVAANAIWVPLPSPLSGTLTSIDVAVA